MGDVRVTLRFGDEFVELECDHAQIASDDDIVTSTPEAANDIPDGYARIVTSVGYEPSLQGNVPMIGEGNTALVREGHVAMIQREG